MEAGGVAQFVRAVHGIKFGSTKPNVHLRTANPYLELDPCNILLPTEALEFSRPHTYVAVMGYGFGGMNACVTAWGKIDDNVEYAKATRAVRQDKISFWPAGGGKLDSSMHPKRDYCIAGTMTDWKPKPMKP